MHRTRENFKHNKLYLARAMVCSRLCLLADCFENVLSFEKKILLRTTSASSSAPAAQFHVDSDSSPLVWGLVVSPALGRGSMGIWGAHSRAQHFSLVCLGAPLHFLPSCSFPSKTFHPLLTLPGWNQHFHRGWDTPGVLESPFICLTLLLSKSCF